jgi:hypothetical protein
MSEPKGADQVLHDSIQYWVKLYSRQRRNKILATSIRVLILVLAACITITVAVDLSSKVEFLPSPYLKVFSIFCSATGVSLAAFEGFMDHKKLWVQSGVSLTKMLLLQQRLGTISAMGQMSKDNLEELLTTMETISEEHVKEWGDGRIKAQDVLHIGQADPAQKRKVSGR